MKYILFVSVLVAESVLAEDLALLPSEIELTHRGAVHGLLIEHVDTDGRFAGDVTAGVTFASSNAGIATVDEAGIVTAAGDGEAAITATVGDATLEVPVTVRGAGAAHVPSFKHEVQPVLFRAGCNTGACHGAADGKNGFNLSLRGFDDASDHAALTRHALGRRVSIAQPDESLILRKPTMRTPHEGGERFTKDSEPYRILRDWIAAGAPPAQTEGKKFTHLEVFPATATLSKDAQQRMLVRAHYDDGTYADVTRWAKFGTTDESVLLVDEDGNVQVQSAGAASVTVWYASKVASAAMIVPREKDVPAGVYANAERRNFIDDLILDKLASLNIAPAAMATDGAFVRRAYLDTIGVLPTPDEVFSFVMDASEEKRAALVDSLLERPEFIDYWTYKWSDLLLLSSKNLARGEELNAFYDYVRSSVAANKPWDEFAGEIVTASGSTTENGAANYFVMHKEKTALAETTTQTFLSLSVSCAKCHNHPLEKWTQDDYYGMTNLFARVKLKNGARGGTDVLPAAFGDVLHPRRGEPLPPKPLDGEPIPLDATDDRREHLADWLTSPENPYFTRAIVNRVWANFMGRGLVEPVDDMRLTNPASNEALLSALADHLIAEDYDLKALMRTIMHSAAYQRASEAADPDAPDTIHYSQYIPRRLPAEVILDAYAQVTGVPTSFPGYGEGTRALQLKDSRVASYFLTAFGRPERNQPCTCERSDQASVAQTLHLANGATLNEKLRDERAVVNGWIEENLPDAEVLDRVYVAALGRYPSDAERDAALALLNDTPDAVTRRQAVEDLVWATLTSKEFLYNH